LNPVIGTPPVFTGAVHYNEIEAVDRVVFADVVLSGAEGYPGAD
jgi:hypothetical protein